MLTKKYVLTLGPSLLIGAALILSTLIAARTSQSDTGWLVLAAPLTLAVAFVGAARWSSTLTARGSQTRADLSPATTVPAIVPAIFPAIVPAMLVGLSFVLASALVSPGQVKTLIPVMGVAGWAALLPLSTRRGKPCRAL